MVSCRSSEEEECEEEELTADGDEEPAITSASVGVTRRCEPKELRKERCVGSSGLVGTVDLLCVTV